MNAGLGWEGWILTDTGNSTTTTERVSERTSLATGKSAGLCHRAAFTSTINVILLMDRASAASVACIGDALIQTT